MKLATVIAFLATALGVAVSQGFVPPGLQYNPFFNPQSQYPYIPAKNFTNPYFSNSGPQYDSNGHGGSPYQPYGYCIENQPHCNGSHSLSIGCLQSQHRVLFRQSYVKPGRWYSKRVKTINYPGDFLPPGFVRNDTITAIKIQDRNCNGTGGYAEVLPGGGVGYRSVSIRLYSLGANKGFNFYVQLFGM